MTYRPCSAEQKYFYDSLSYAPAAVATFHVAAVAASQILWVASTSNDGNSKDKDSPTIYWLLPSLSFDLAAVIAYPTCNSIIEREGRVSVEETEHQIKMNSRLAAGISLLGQFVSLTNTLDSSKRHVTQTLMGTTLVTQFLFEWLWSYREAPAGVVFQPYIDKDAKGLKVVFRF